MSSRKLFTTSALGVFFVAGITLLYPQIAGGQQKEKHQPEVPTTEPQIQSSIPLEIETPTIIQTEKVEKPIYIISPRKLTLTELYDSACKAGAAPISTRGVLVSDLPEPQAPAAARARRFTIYVYKGHVIWPPRFRSYLYFNCYKAVVAGQVLALR